MYRPIVAYDDHQLALLLLAFVGNLKTIIGPIPIHFAAFIFGLDHEFTVADLTDLGLRHAKAIRAQTL